MKLVPVFYLRKPWYILLKYTTVVFSTSKEWRKELTGVRDEIAKNVTYTLGAEKLKMSSEEAAYTHKLKISYDPIYIIRSSAIGKICLFLPHYWYKMIIDDQKYSHKIEELYKVAFRGKEASIKSSLQEKINGPLSKINVPLNGEPVVYDTMARCLCMLAKYACKENDEELSEIDKILESINDLPSLSEKIKPEEKEKRAIEKHDLFWRQADDNEMPGRFSDSHWACHERTDPNSTVRSTWGIAKSHIFIGKQNNRGYSPIEFKSRYNEKSYESAGIITYDVDSKYLIAQLIRQSGVKDDTPETPAFFVMSVRDAENQSLLVGHYINYSIYFERFITKTVIWTEEEAEFIPQDLINVDEDFKKIDISIRRYLYSRLQNRLTLPQRGFSNLKNENDKDRSLFVWLEQRISSVYHDKKLLACADKYYVCYFYGDALGSKKFAERQISSEVTDTEALHDYITKYIRIDELEITYDDNAVDFAATYTHYTHEAKNGMKKVLLPNFYKGKVVRKNLTVQVFAEYEKYKYLLPKRKTTTGNFILLNFKLPLCNEDKAIEVFNNTDYFEGIVSGLSDSGNDPLSFRALVIKRRQNDKKKNMVKLNFADKNNRNDISIKIIKYFEDHLAQHQIKI